MNRLSLALLVLLAASPALAAPAVTIVDQFGNATNSTNIATNQVSVTATATQIVAARPGRGAVTIVNNGTTALFIGGSGVTATTGLPIPGVVGASITIPTAAAVYGITASGTQTVGELETY